MSRIAAPVGLVTTPIARGKRGRAFLAPGSNNPSARSFSTSWRKANSSAPAPLGVISSTYICSCPRTSYTSTCPATTTSRPSVGVNFSREARLRNIAASIAQFASFSRKYRCPEVCRFTLLSSPTTYPRCG